MTNREYPKWLYHATENDVVLAADPGVEVELRGRGYRDALTHFGIGAGANNIDSAEQSVSYIGVTSDPQTPLSTTNENHLQSALILTVSEAPVNPPQNPPSKKAKKR